MHANLGSIKQILVAHSGTNGVCVKSVAFWAGVSESTSGRWFRGEKKPDGSEAMPDIQEWRQLVANAPEELSRDLHAWANQGLRLDAEIGSDKGRCATAALLGLMKALGQTTKTVTEIYEDGVADDGERAEALGDVAAVEEQIAKLKACLSRQPQRVRLSAAG